MNQSTSFMSYTGENCDTPLDELIAKHGGGGAANSDIDLLCELSDLIESGEAVVCGSSIDMNNYSAAYIVNRTSVNSAGSIQLLECKKITEEIIVKIQNLLSKIGGTWGLFANGRAYSSNNEAYICFI